MEPADTGVAGRAPDHVPVPVCELQPEDRPGRATDSRPGGRCHTLAQGTHRNRRRRDAAPCACRERDERDRCRAESDQAELPAPVGVSAPRSALCAAAVRRRRADALPVPGAPGRHGAGGRGGVRPRRAVARSGGRGRDHAPPAGVRHGGAPVPRHQRRADRPGGTAWRAGAVPRPAAGPGHPRVVPLAAAHRGDRPGLGLRGHRGDHRTGGGGARGLAARPLRQVPRHLGGVPAAAGAGPGLRARPASHTRHSPGSPSTSPNPSHC